LSAETEIWTVAGFVRSRRQRIDRALAARKKKQRLRTNVVFMKHGALVIDAKAKLARRPS